MTVASYRAQLDSAYGRPTAREVIDSVKQVVTNEIRTTDEHVNIRTTDYFDHSFAPDIVLSWQDTRDERFVFLRSSLDRGHFGEDLQLIEDTKPIIFSLAPITEGRYTDFRRDSATYEANALLTDADGLEEISERRRESRVVSIATSSVLQGGRGLLDGFQASAVASGLTRGFLAAANTSTEETREAVQLISHFFDKARASRLTGFLQAVWIGAGGTPSQFPSTTQTTGLLDDNALSFLIDLEPRNDLEYWRRVGRSVQLEQLGRLNISQPSANLQSLIAANLDRLLARVCRIVSSEKDLFDEREFGWILDDAQLALRSSKYTAYFAQTTKDLKVDEWEQSGISIEELRARARSAGTPIESLELATGLRRLSYGTEGHELAEDIADDKELIEVSRSLGSDARVKRAGVTLAEGRSLTCNFSTTTANGRTGAKYPLADLAPAAISLMAPLEPDEKTIMDDMVRENKALDAQQFLF